VKRSIYTLGFMAALGAVCAALLTAVGQLTGERYAHNRQAEELLIILTALEPTYDSAAPARRVLRDFETMIPCGDEKLGDLTVYRYGRGGTVRAVAVRFCGPGLWGPIEGYLVLEPDMETIRSLAITRHEETPGLGGEIASEEFRRQWGGKRIVSPEGTVGVFLTAAGTASGKNEVDAITGATMTSNALEKMINELIAKIPKEPPVDEQ